MREVTHIPSSVASRAYSAIMTGVATIFGSRRVTGLAIA
jgi:hypothetical protein